MPLTKDEYARGARLVYINTPESRRLFSLLIQTDRIWRRINRAFVQGRISVEQLKELHDRLGETLRGLKALLHEGDRLVAKNMRNSKKTTIPAPVSITE